MPALQTALAEDVLHMEDKASDPFEWLLSTCVGDKAEMVRGNFRLRAPEPEAGICFSCAELFADGGRNLMLGKLASRYGNVPVKPLISFWSLGYFSRLCLTAGALWLYGGRQLPVAPETMQVVLDPETGIVVGFVLPNTGHIAELLEKETKVPTSCTRGLDLEPEALLEGLAPLIFGHLAPVITALKARTRMSPRLLWCNAETYLEWMLFESGAEEAAKLLRNSPKIAGEPNPFRNLLLRHGAPEEGQYPTRRRICCMRNLLPGVPGCGELCPLKGAGRS